MRVHPVLRRMGAEIRQDWLHVKRATMEDVGYAILGAFVLVLLAGVMR